jgi:hypothetical protein
MNPADCADRYRGGFDHHRQVRPRGAMRTIRLLPPSGRLLCGCKLPLSNIHRNDHPVWIYPHLLPHLPHPQCSVSDPVRPVSGRPKGPVPTGTRLMFPAKAENKRVTWRWHQASSHQITGGYRFGNFLPDRSGGNGKKVCIPASIPRCFR